jgi:UMF1 family MFS transporter
MVMMPEWWNIRWFLPAFFLSVGIWWIGFAQITFFHLPNNIFHKESEKDYIFKGLRACSLKNSKIF